MDERQRTALVMLGRCLQHAGYRFVTVSPETHRRVNEHAPPLAVSLRDVFGWSRPFGEGCLPSEMKALLAEAGALEETPMGWRATVRFSTLGARLFVHSAYPTLEPSAVFFGPDTYRFCAFIQAEARAARRVVDVGCGSGVGGLVAAAASGARELVLADISPRALELTAVNVALAGVADDTAVELVESDVLAAVSGDFDLLVANPPYLNDEAGRVYRDGGGAFGEALAVRIVSEGLLRLTPGGRLLLYTGTAIVDGEDVFRRALGPLLAGSTVRHRYRELDPDVFGEELDRPAYRGVDRIAAVALVMERL